MQHTLTNRVQPSPHLKHAFLEEKTTKNRQPVSRRLHWLAGTSHNRAPLERGLVLLEEGQQPLTLMVLWCILGERGATLGTAARARLHVRRHIVRPTVHLADWAGNWAVSGWRGGGRLCATCKLVGDITQQLALVHRLQDHRSTTWWPHLLGRHGASLAGS